MHTIGKQFRKQSGFSLIELLIVVAIILIIAAFAIPNLEHNTMQANEASAITSLQAITESSILYMNTYGGYPPALSSLGPGNPAGPNAANILDSILASGAKSGYNFVYVPGTTDPAGHVLTYSVTAQPISVGSTGQRSFYTDQSGVVRANATGVANASSTPIG